MTPWLSLLMLVLSKTTDSAARRLLNTNQTTPAPIGTISCGETREGSILPYETIEFAFVSTKGYYLVYLESCKSNYLTALGIRDSNNRSIGNESNKYYEHGDAQNFCGDPRAGDVTIPYAIYANKMFTFTVGGQGNASGNYSVTLFCYGPWTLSPSKPPLPFGQTYPPNHNPTAAPIPSISCGQTLTGFILPYERAKFLYTAVISYNSVMFDGSNSEFDLGLKFEIQDANGVVIVRKASEWGDADGYPSDITFPGVVMIGDQYIFVIEGKWNRYGVYSVTLVCNSILQTSPPTTAMPTTIISPTQYPSDNPIIPTIAPTPLSYCDGANTLSGWELTGNVSVSSSPNCPTTTNLTSQFKGEKICVSKSFNTHFDGQYEWQYFDENIYGSIYYNQKSNKYLYQYYSEYYLKDYVEDTIMMVKCAPSFDITDIRDCNGYWQYLENNAWITDEDMVATTCNDISVHTSGDTYYPFDVANGDIFVWSHYDVYETYRHTVQSNIYKCMTCTQQLSTEVLIYGYIDQDGDAWWQLDNDYEYDQKPYNGYLSVFDDSDFDNKYREMRFFRCRVYDSDFDISDCMGKNADWNPPGSIPFYIETYVDKENYALETLSELPNFQESQICVENSYNQSLNGLYKWMYYESDVKGSVYYNLQKNMYIQPYLNSSTDSFQYHIYGYNENQMLHAKCNAVNSSVGIAKCIGKWEVYYGNEWNIDPYLIVTPCQDICIEGHFIPDYNGKYVYSHFDVTQMSNVYFCSECRLSLYGCGYVDGYGEGGYYWVIGDYTKKNYCGYKRIFESFSTKCQVNCNNATTNYIFDIEECFNFHPHVDCNSYYWDYYGSWHLYDENANLYEHYNYAFLVDSDSRYDNYYMYWYDQEHRMNLGISKCLPKAIDHCIEMEPKSEMYRRYEIHESVDNFALSFDMNVDQFAESSSLMVEYSCDLSVNSDETLVEFNADLAHSPILNFIYNLPANDCDESSAVSITFRSNSIELIYIDNICLHSDASQIIFSDEMNKLSQWTPKSENVFTVYNSNSYCPSDGYCYLLQGSSETKNEISITKTVTLPDFGHIYKDMNLKWSLITDGLSDEAILNVKMQCNNNFFIVNDLCVIQSYDSVNDCMDSSCAVQSYNLPLECDLSLQIIIQFQLHSSVPTDQIYIDYVSLTHSDKSGQVSPLCRTSSPTTEPSNSPTDAPTSAPSQSPTASPETPAMSVNDFITTPAYMTPLVVGIVLFLLILICSLKKYFERKYKKEMTISNPMVILIAIGFYDQNPQNPDIDGVLTDLNLDKDIPNLTELFGENLNYDIYPKYNESPKLEWKQSEIVELLNSKAKDFNENLAVAEPGNKYDGLVVAISCHGLNQNICTSDYKLIEKTAIHRIFSSAYPEVRRLPRVFLFDCCDGDDERGTVRYESDSDSDNSNDCGKAPLIQFAELKEEEIQLQTEQAKNYSHSDIQRANTDIWHEGDKNPDHMLVEIHAANAGFQSKLDTVTGSYMLASFVNQTLDDINDGKGNKCLFEIFDAISTELEDKGKQKIVSTYNDKTRYIKFKKNDGNNDNENVEIEMITHRVINSSSTVGEGETENTDIDKPVSTLSKAVQLLSDWGIGSYAEILINEGYDDVNYWKHISVQELKGLGFKTGHAIKFVDMASKL